MIFDGAMVLGDRKFQMDLWEFNAENLIADLAGM